LKPNATNDEGECVFSASVEPLLIETLSLKRVIEAKKMQLLHLQSLQKSHRNCIMSKEKHEDDEPPSPLLIKSFFSLY
jgi:hypothetical protein